MTEAASIGQRWQLERRLSATHPSLAGHFPGLPVYPGVVLLAEVLEAALTIESLAAWLGVSPRIDSVKFLSPVMPADGAGDVPVSITFSRRGTGLDFELHCGAVVAARGQMAPGKD
jgi:3-hydroxyacyl-[acyl-carrier-protein] dehydratase